MKKMSALGRGLGVLCLSMASLAAAAGDRCTASKLEMPVEMLGAQPIVKVGINGTTVRLLADSGAFFSSLSPAAADQLKLRLGNLPFGMRIEGVAGEMEAQLTTVEHLQFQGGDIPNVEFVVGGNEIGAGAMGILGRNLLTITDTEFDLASGMIRLFFPKGDCAETSFAYWADDKPYVVLPLLRDDNNKRSKRPEIRAVAQVNGERIKVLFDTGAATSVISLSAAKRAGITPEQMKPHGHMVGVGKGTLKAWTANFEQFALGEEKISNVRLTIADLDMPDAEMLVGADFFLAHRIYVSKAQRRMYFTHNGGPVFAYSERPAVEAQKAAALPPTAASAASAASSASAPATAADDASTPEDAASYARRGAGFASRRDYAAALAEYDRACALAPDQPDYFVRRGAVHLALHHGREARKDFNIALQLNPTHTEALLHRAGMQPTSTGRDAALADLKTLDATLPSQAVERLQMAVIYERFEQPREAIAQLTQWTATRETDIALPDVLSWRCALRTQLGIELDEALADCDQAVKAESKTPRYRENRGLLRLKRGEPDKALADFDKALDLKADSPWALYGRAIVRSQRGQTEASRADLEAARKLRPQVDTQLAKFGLPVPG